MRGSLGFLSPKREEEEGEGQFAHLPFMARWLRLKQAVTAGCSFLSSAEQNRQVAVCPYLVSLRGRSSCSGWATALGWPSLRPHAATNGICRACSALHLAGRGPEKNRTGGIIFFCVILNRARLVLGKEVHVSRFPNVPSYVIRCAALLFPFRKTVDSQFPLRCSGPSLVSSAFSPSITTLIVTLCRQRPAPLRSITQRLPVSKRCRVSRTMH